MSVLQSGCLISQICAFLFSSVTYLSSRQCLCWEKTLLSHVLSWVFLHFLSSWHLLVKMALKPSGRAPALVMGQKMNLTPGWWSFLLWLCPPHWLLPQLLFSSSNSCAISISSLGFKFLLPTFSYREEKGEGHISAKNEIMMKSWCPSCQWSGIHWEMVGCPSGPLLFCPHTWSSLQTSVPSCTPHPALPKFPPASYFRSPLVSGIFFDSQIGMLDKGDFLFFFFLKKIYLFYSLAVLGLCYCTQTFYSCGKRGLLSSCGAWAFQCKGLSCCWAQALRHVGSGVVAHKLSCSTAYGIFLDEGSNWCAFHCKADS